MELELISQLAGRRRRAWEALLAQTGLQPEADPQVTALLWEEDTLAATASRQGNLLKYIAVDPSFQGQDLTARLITALRQDGLRQGLRHLFLYTKPKNRQLFEPLFFYPVAQTGDVLLMENRKDGIAEFLSQFPPRQEDGIIGAAVMNCNPFTKGHRYLIETAAAECRQLYVFVLSEDLSQFSAADRLEMVRRGTAHLPNVTVLPTGPYLISSATFPTYFLKDREQAGDVQCLLDIQIFANHYAPHFGITRRYVGAEPLSPMTARYNQALHAHLPGYGIEVREIPRLALDETPISASAVRLALAQGEDIRHLVPESTYQYLTQGGTHHA